MKKYTYHPACLAFPMLPEAELHALADDIKANGLLQPIVIWRGQILDGRNRLAACEIADVPPRFVEWDSDASPLLWVISTNLVRRHLTASQRAVIALEVLPLLEKEAKERQRLSTGRGEKIAKKFATFGKASEAAARLTRSNSRYVETVKSISKTAPDLVDQIRTGQVTVPDAKRLALLPKAERKKVLQMVANEDTSVKRLINQVKIEGRNERAEKFRKANRNGNNQNILVGNMSLLWERLKDNSVSLFLTDPPYSEVIAYQELAKLAAAKLQPGGLCLAYSGQFWR